MAGTTEIFSHDIISINSSNGHRIVARYWQADQPVATVVMVHGVVSHSLWLSSIANQLQPHNINVLAVDRRGCGLDNINRGHAGTTAALLEDLESVCCWAKRTHVPVHLCGFCWGSNYVLNYLQNNDCQITSVILLAPSIFPASWLLKSQIKVGTSSTATETPVMPIDQFTKGEHYQGFIIPDSMRLKKVTPSFNRCMQEFSSNIWLKFLKIRLPCLMLLASDDGVVDNASTQKLFERLSGVSKKMITLKANHGIQFDQPIKASNIIKQWIETL